MADKTIEEPKQAHHHHHDQGEGQVVSTATPVQMATATQKGKFSVKVHDADGQAYFTTVDAKHLTAPDAKSKNKFDGIVTILSIPSDPIL